MLSRSLSGLGIAAFPCAKDSGLARTFADGADRKKCRGILFLEAAAATALMIWFQPGAGLLGAAAGWLVFLACRRMCMKKFGGITGDTQGFFLQMCELIMAMAVIIGDVLWF